MAGASPSDIRSLVQVLNLQDHKQLTIIYAVPKSRLVALFETLPVNLLLETPDLVKNVVIYIDDNW